MSRKAELTEYDWHEALDRAFIVADWFDQYVAIHAVVRESPELRRLARDIGSHLGELYQAVGRNDPFVQGLSDEPAETRRKGKRE